MRMKLGKLKAQRKRFTCLFLRRERRANMDLVLLTAVRQRGEQVADHLWVEDGYWSRGWHEHDQVRIEGRVEEYVRRSGRRDYRFRDLHPVKNYTAVGEAVPES